MKQIYKRISENQIKLESMESHSDHDYMILLRKSNEEQKEHKKDLRLFVDMLCKYKVTIKWFTKQIFPQSNSIKKSSLFISPMTLLCHTMAWGICATISWCDDIHPNLLDVDFLFPHVTCRTSVCYLVLRFFQKYIATIITWS